MGYSLKGCLAVLSECSKAHLTVNKTSKSPDQPEHLLDINGRRWPSFTLPAIPPDGREDGLFRCEVIHEKPNIRKLCLNADPIVALERRSDRQSTRNS